MVVLAALLAAFAVGVSAFVREPLLKQPPAALWTTNFRGSRVPIVGGLTILATILASEALFTLVSLLRPLGVTGGNARLSPSSIPLTFVSSQRAGILLLALGFFALGLLDDLSEPEQARGLTGHARALMQGRVTGGVLKAAGGGAVALVAAGIWGSNLGKVVLDALVVALAANLFNLLDLRPGRAGKFFVLSWVPLAAVASSTIYLPATAAAAVALAVWLPADLSERGILGDGGSNLLGALIGAGLALTLTLPFEIGALVVLAGLTIVSEFQPFSNIIERVPPLRWLDSLGRMPG